MTRKRTGETVTEQMDQPCHYCEGTGRIASAESVSFRIQRELRRLSRQQKSEAFQVHCHPFVAAHFVGEEGEEVESLEHAIGRGVYVRAAIGVHLEQFEIAGGRLDELDRRHATLRRGQIIEGRVAHVGETAQGEAMLVTDDGHLISIPQGNRQLRQTVRARIISIGRSVAKAEPLAKGDGGSRGGDRDVPTGAPPKSVEGGGESAGGGRRRRRRGGRDNSAAA